MQPSVSIQTLRPQEIFRISRATRREVQNVFLHLKDGPSEAWGEASPNSFYHETAEEVARRLAELRPALDNLSIEDGVDLEALWDHHRPLLEPSRAAMCALDVALWHLLAAKQGCSLPELLWKQPLTPIETFVTIGRSNREELDRKLAEYANWPRLKLKSGEAPILADVEYVLHHSAAKLSIDANCAWSSDNLLARSQELAASGKILLLEQPLAPENDEALRGLDLPLPVYADESCVTETSLPNLVGKYCGINIKLVKCGGITPARRMIREAREKGFQIMIGCMLESSCLIHAGFAIAQQADHADLDGALLLANDPFDLFEIERGTMTLNRAAASGQIVPIDRGT